MQEAVFEKYARHVNPAFIELLGVFGYGRLFTRARDVWVWDSLDRRYLDLLAGYGSVNIGHNHPRLVERLREFLGEEALVFSHAGPSSHAADLAEKLAGLLPPSLGVTLFSSSGAEAVEAGMKLAKAATGRSGILYCGGGFHGTNLGSLSVMGHPRMRQAFEPLLPECRQVPFGDLSGLEKGLKEKTPAAFLVEPIQCEAGVVLPAAGYLHEAKNLCRRHGALLILDEVQTGLGRTGTLFAFKAEEVVPDILVLAKALSGGIAPIAATVTSPDIHKRAYGSRDRFDLHSSTFAGNAFSCAAALETLKILDEEALVSRSAGLGRRLLEGLRRRLEGHPLVKEIRGRGLLVGIEFGPGDLSLLHRLAPNLVSLISEKVMGQWIALKLLEKGYLCQPASQQWNVLKLEPPLTVKEEHIDLMIAAVAETLDDYQALGRVAWDAASRIIGRKISA